MIAPATLVLKIWKSKWRIASLAALLFVIAGAYIFKSKDIATVRVELRRLPLGTNTQFSDLNFSIRRLTRRLGYIDASTKQAVLATARSRVLLSAQISKGIDILNEISPGEVFNEEYYLLESSRLFSVYLDHIKNKEAFVEPFRSVFLTGEESNPERRLIRKIQQIKFIQPGTIRVGWGVSFQTLFPDKSLIALSQVLDKASEQVKADSISRIQSLIEQAENQDSLSIKALQDEIDREIKNYDRVLQVQLSALRESAAIARELDIASNTLETLPLSSANTIVTGLSNNGTKTYLEGYKAIEKQIALRTSRKNKRDYIPKLLEMEQKILSIQGYGDVKQVKLQLERSVLTKKDFKVASFGKMLMSVRYGRGKIAKLVIALMISCFLSFVLVAGFITGREILDDLQK